MGKKKFKFSRFSKREKALLVGMTMLIVFGGIAFTIRDILLQLFQKYLVGLSELQISLVFLGFLFTILAVLVYKFNITTTG